MVKTYVVFAVFLGLPLIFPDCSLASNSKLAGHDGKSVQDFLYGKSNKLEGVDHPLITPKEQEGRSFSIKPFYEFSPIHRIERDINSKPWLLLWKPGEDSGSNPSCNGKSVEDFLKGKCDKLHGFDARPVDHVKRELPPAWGEDEFVKIEGFTQSGAPYQNVNPLYGIDNPENNRFRFKPLPELPEEWKSVK